MVTSEELKVARMLVETGNERGVLFGCKKRLQDFYSVRPDGKHERRPTTQIDPDGEILETSL